MWKQTKTGPMLELFSLPLGYAGWKDEEVAFMYIGNSGVLLRTRGGTVAFDVANLLTIEEVNAMQNLNLILFTHSHEDHYRQRNAVEMANATGATVVAEPSVASDLEGKVPADRLVSAEPGGTYDVGGFKVAAISGVHRGPIVLYHVKVGGISALHCGDSGYVPLKEHAAKIAFLPTGSPSPTASPKDALRMALDCRPKVAIAIHGSGSQSKEFERGVKRQMPETTAIIPERYKPKKVAL